MSALSHSSIIFQLRFRGKLLLIIFSFNFVILMPISYPKRLWKEGHLPSKHPISSRLTVLNSNGRLKNKDASSKNKSTTNKILL